MMPMRLSGRTTLGLFCALLAACATEQPTEDVASSTNQALRNAVPSATGTAGLLAGVRSWVVPATANGLVSVQSWFSVGSAPDGAVYVSTNDHLTNSALFRLGLGSNSLRYVGDARTASEAASNWLDGETAEKFHVRPLWFKDRVYLATADYSNQDDGYLLRRGFHWYAYDEPSRNFLDLSATEPDGVAAAHISIFSSALDEKRGLLYGLGSPTSHLYQYDIAKGVTVDLGRPEVLTRPFYNPGRFLWVDSGGAVHFTVGTAGTLAPGEPATPTYVLSWDPKLGWTTHPDWQITEMLRTGQWSRDHKRCYILDYPLNLYVFDDEAKTLTWLGQGKLTPEHVSARTGKVRVRSVQLSANEKKIYFVNDSALVNSLYEWDFTRTMTPEELSPVGALDSQITAAYTGITGHDAWDTQGRFYFTIFGGEGVPATPNVLFLGVDPVRLKVALGRLPCLTEVRLSRGHHRRLIRQGNTVSPLDVLLESANGRHRKWVTIPAGRSEVALSGGGGHVDWQAIPDGDTYVLQTHDRAAED